jgi:PQQ-dependent dehydrogenase (methanol/ethanol family)
MNNLTRGDRVSAWLHGKFLARTAAPLLAAALATGVPAERAWAQTGSQGSGAQWTTPAGTPEGTRYSGLNQITSANVGTLVEDFSVPTGSVGSHEGQPLVVGTVMYVVTPFPNKLEALDLANKGKTLWTFTPRVNGFAHGVACCDVVNRGAAYATTTANPNGLIVFATLDDGVVAVDAKTGKQVWRTSLGDPHSGMTMPGAPLIAKNVVIVGNSGGEMGVRGWVTGLDLATGKQIWQFYNTGSDPDVGIGSGFHAFYPKDQGMNLGTTTWPGTMWQQGGATVWSWITYDSELNLFFYGTSNPGVWNPDMRPGDNKWGASVFARDPATGKAVWVYQLTPHDGWDFDAISEYIAVDLPYPKGGPVRKLLVQFDKNG